MSAMAPYPQMAPLHTLNKTQIPPPRPFGGWPLPLSLTLPARLALDQILKPHRPFCSSSQFADVPLRAVLFCLSEMLRSWLLPALMPFGSLFHSRLLREALPGCSIQIRSPPPAPVLYSLPCFIFLQSTSHYLLLHHSLCGLACCLSSLLEWKLPASRRLVCSTHCSSPSTWNRAQHWVNVCHMNEPKVSFTIYPSPSPKPNTQWTLNKKF